MAKFHGVIGFRTIAETAPGVFTEAITEKSYYGDILRNTQRLESSGQVNDNLAMSNQFSIMPDDYALSHMSDMRYIMYLGMPWKVKTIEFQRPRVIVSVGELYNAT